jgi:hypothetical protein
MKRQLQIPIRLGDIDDLEAFVSGVVRTTLFPRPLTPDETGEMVSEGLALAWARFVELGESRKLDSLQEALGGWLGSSLQKSWFRIHREFRDNRRAGTKRVVPLEVFDDEQTRFSDDGREQREIFSRLAMAPVSSEADLRNPQFIGRMRPVAGLPPSPSHMGLATVMAAELFALTLDERDGSPG